MAFGNLYIVSKTNYRKYSSQAMLLHECYRNYMQSYHQSSTLEKQLERTQYRMHEEQYWLLYFHDLLPLVKRLTKLLNNEYEKSKQLLAILFEQFPVSRLEWNLWSNEKSFSIRFRPMTRVVRCFTVANVYDLYWSVIGSSKCKLPQRRNGSIKGATVSSCPVFCITE